MFNRKEITPPPTPPHKGGAMGGGQGISDVQWEKPYSYGMSPGGTVCIFENGEKVMEVTKRNKYGFDIAGFAVSAMNWKHNYLKRKSEQD
jgi:hypothetical protein